MPTFRISSDSVTVSVESDNWLYAIANALPQFGLDPAALDQLICSRNPDGSVDVVDVVGEARIRIDPPENSPAPPLEMSSTELSDAEAHDDGELVPPPRSWGWDVAVPTDRLAVALERSAEIRAAPDVVSACNLALEIVTSLVAAESGAVLFRKGSPQVLTFIAATGPRANRVLGAELPMMEGIAGFSFMTGIGIVVRDVERDGRFASAIDRSSGYRTRSLLATPVRVVDGPIFGCLELLNAPEGFASTDLEVVKTVALALGARLRTTPE